MPYARIADGAVAEIIDLPEGLDLADDPDIVAELVSCPEDVEQGWILSDGQFTAPSTPAPTQADLKLYAASKRYSIETGGYHKARKLLREQVKDTYKLDHALDVTRVSPGYGRYV